MIEPAVKIFVTRLANVNISWQSIGKLTAFYDNFCAMDIFDKYNSHIKAKLKHWFKYVVA